MSSKVKELQPATEITNATKPRGTLFVVSSPSGGGKGTIIQRVLDVVPNLSYSVSFTTRAPRNNELNGREYFFVGRQVFEEMVRLRSHLSQFQEALNAPGEAGKMLDFLLQELNREANTTLSKSTDLVIKEAGLAIKAEVEKLREQVQNVE